MEFLYLKRTVSEMKNWMGITIDKTVKNKVTINVATQEKKTSKLMQRLERKKEKNISI